MEHMKSVKVLSCLAVLAIVTLALAPLAEAQCVPSRAFASAANGTTKNGFGQVGVSPAGVTPVGDEIGRFWTSTDSTLGNNFGGTCLASQFWKLNTAANQLPNGALRIDGAAGAAGCSSNTCPDNTLPLTVVVEDWGTAAPGINGDAYFIAWQVAPVLGTAPRTWDFARTGNTAGATQTTFPWVQFPLADVTSSNRVGNDVSVTLHYADVAPNFHGASGGADGAGQLGTPLPATSTIVSFDLMYHVGITDPGRSRSLWTPLTTVPYPGMNVPAVIQNVVCPDQVSDAFIAVGITFEGGNGPDVPSTLVGRATQIECNPNLAEPQQQPTQRLQQKQEDRRPAGRR
jgi:hypothetical protein